MGPGAKAGAAPAPHGGAAPAIALDHASYSYDGLVWAVEDVSLEVAAGEFVAVLGGNGSGKSTLARLLDGLAVPQEGSVRILGAPTSDEASAFEARRHVGLVFQNPDDQLVAGLVENDVAFGPENLGVAPARLRGLVDEALREVGLTGYQQRDTASLSGGQKQRVAIAGALAMGPRILVLDEATAMLDPRGRAGLMRVVRELRARGLTVVMVTHFMEEAALADRVVVMDAGRIAMEGSPDEVLVRADELAALNLDVPFACRLAMRLAAGGMPVAPCITDEEPEGELCASFSRM